MQSRYYRIVVGVLVALWIGLLFLPAATFGNDIWHGRHFLLYGWAGALMFQFGWWANLLFLGAMARLGGLGRMSAANARFQFAALALLLVNALFWRGIPENEGSMTPKPPDVYGPAFWLWWAVMLATAALLWHRLRQPDPE